MDPQKIAELANLLRKNGDKILSSEFTLTLSGTLLRALNDSFTLIADSADMPVGFGNSHQHQQTFQVVKPINAKSSVFPDLQLLHDFVQKTTLLKLNYFPSEHYYEGIIDITKFRALRRLEVHKIRISQVVGIQALRSQLHHLICIKSLNCVEDIITHCGGDNSNGFVWNELQSADFSYNNLRTVDTALEFAQYLQHLNLRHNKLVSVSAIKWLPHLKTLDLSYNCLTHLPQFHAEACKRLQLLNISNNYVEELLDMTKLDALTSMDLSDNCLLEHSQLLPLSVLVTLTTLNLQGNPLACHPKHRLATAQYLHKNTATVKFVLDFELLSKAEKALTGSLQLRFLGTLGHRRTPSNTSILSSNTSATIPRTPSVGSQTSLLTRNKDTSSETEQSPFDSISMPKRRIVRRRTVEISEHSEVNAAKPATVAPVAETVSQSQAEENDSTELRDKFQNLDYLETKKQIETLRLKFGDSWLESGNTESTLGISTPQPSDQERNNGNQQYIEYINELSPETQEPQKEPELLNISSTPSDKNNWPSTFETTLTPIKSEGSKIQSDLTQQTVYESCDNTVETQYESMINTTLQEEQEQDIDNLDEILSPYANTSGEQDDEEEQPVSDMEPDEKLYVVCQENKPSESLFLTISTNYLRERDALTERTITKWSLKILESCERIKSNCLCLNFDTMQRDKQERRYCAENVLCQKLEKKLRDILSQRDLSEMIINYRCINCKFEFSRERRVRNYKSAELCCPHCGSEFVAEVNDASNALEAPQASTSIVKLSPAQIVEESLLSTPLVLQPKEDNQSIGSANSLNESSSCSKITNSQCSFDSNQSVVGSSNTDRDIEFRANESDVDIISNPSQSSIEVLDPNCAQSASRKTSEERRISQLSDLQTSANDPIYSQSFIEREFGHLLARQANNAIAAAAAASASTPDATPKSKALSHVQLTESSSSGSVTDSICTTYEQQGKHQNQSPDDVVTIHNVLSVESAASAVVKQPNPNNDNQLAEAERLRLVEEPGLSAVFGALISSTNKLMSSSKKFIEEEAGASIVHPYKFNYSDFNDIDHRLKLYFYQNKFKESNENFKWLVKGRVYNEQMQKMRDGMLVVSNCKCYLMEAFAPPQDDVSKWLRQVVSVPVNRLAQIQLLPWKLGFSITLREWGSFVLLLDVLRTDNLILYWADNPLPVCCELIQTPVPGLRQRLSSLIPDPLKMCSVLGGCQWSTNEQKRKFDVCTLLTTDTHLHIAGDENVNWLTAKEDQQPHIELSLTQQMTNLVEVERITDSEYNIIFLDETESKRELWRLQFETPENAEYCLNVIGQSWEQHFGVPLSYSET